MRRLALVAATVVALPLTSIDARANGPWCAYDNDGGTNCGFYSYAQCMADISGIGGYCGQNPSYQGNANQRRRSALGGRASALRTPMPLPPSSTGIGGRMLR
jgi:hypothetical protein